MTPTRRLRHAVGRRPGVHVAPHDADPAFVSPLRRRPGLCVTPYDADPAFASRRTTPTRRSRHARSAANTRTPNARSASSRVTPSPGQRLPA